MTASEMGIVPSEFWAMTMGDLAAYREGYDRRLERDRERLAAALAFIANVIPRAMAKRPKTISAEQLLGRTPEKKATSLAEMREAHDRLRLRGIRRMERETS